MANYPQSASIRRLFAKGQPMMFGASDIILGNQPTPNGVYYINSGYVKAYSISNQGDEYMHLVYGQGELFPLVWAYLNVISSIVFF